MSKFSYILREGSADGRLERVAQSFSRLSKKKSGRIFELAETLRALAGVLTYADELRAKGGTAPLPDSAEVRNALRRYSDALHDYHDRYEME
jgi:hypothetical protein